MLSATPLDLCGVTSSDSDSSRLLQEWQHFFAHFSLHEVIFSTEDLKKFLLFGGFSSRCFIFIEECTLAFPAAKSSHRMRSDLCHLAFLCFVTLTKANRCDSVKMRVPKFQHYCADRSTCVNSADLFLPYFHICNLATAKYLLSASFYLQDFMFRM